LLASARRWNSFTSHIGIDGDNLLAADVTLVAPNVVCRVVDHLTLQIAIPLIGVHQAQGSDARSGQIQRAGAPRPPAPMIQHLGREQFSS